VFYGLFLVGFDEKQAVLKKNRYMEVNSRYMEVGSRYMETNSRYMEWNSRDI